MFGGRAPDPLRERMHSPQTPQPQWGGLLLRGREVRKGGLLVKERGGNQGEGKDSGPLH